MNFKLLTILLTVVTLTTASAPYCVYGTTKATFLRDYVDYTCQIDVDGQLDVLNEIWGLRDPDDPKRDEDVKILTVMGRSKSLMTIFSPIFCEQFPNIEVIDMSDAKIEKVKLTSLKNCRNLEVVQFYRNKLSDIDEHFLSNNRNLKELYLNYNKFITFPQHLFKNLQDLQVLDLSANILDDLPYNIFNSLQNLKTLKLDTNQLRILNPDWFFNLENLQNLDLSSNEIAELPENVFSSLYNLKTLNLDKNNLKIISSYSFDQHPKLGTVSFYKNDINAIDQRFIEKCKIKSLNMKGNACSDDPKINGKDLDRKLNRCFKNFKFIGQEPETPTTTTTKTTTTSRRTTTRKPTTTTEPTTTTTKTTTTTTRTTTRRSASRMLTQITEPIRTTTEPLPEIRSDIDEDLCGERHSGVSLVIKGYDFDHGSYPWVAVLVVDGKVHCGGVLISRAKIITAGHCILTKSSRKIDPKEITAVLGGYNLNLLHEVDRVAFSVIEAHVHPKWNQFLQRYDSDIAVLILREELTYNLHVRPICVAQPNTRAMEVSDGTVVGYGKTEDTSKQYSNVPKQADTPIHDLDTCLRLYPNIQTIAHHTTFCGGHGNGTGACTGDSGGGLFVKIGNVFYLRGIVSASLSGDAYGCNVEAYSLFTDITQFIPWIHSVGQDSISVRFDREKPVRFEPPWLTTTQRSSLTRLHHDGRPIW